MRKIVSMACLLSLTACANSTRTVPVPVVRVEERGFNLIESSPMTPNADGCATVLDRTTTGTYERTVCFYKGQRVTN